MFKLSHILLNPRRAERHPLEMVAVGFFYVSLSIFLGMWVFPEHTSIVMVFLTVMASLYVVQGAIIMEESKEKEVNSERWLLKEHFKALSFLMFVFLGFLLGFTFWTLALPAETVTFVFSAQAEAVEGIRALTGSAISSEHFLPIFLNNMRVLILSLLFALFYGAGALFILAWNASVIGFVIGESARNVLGLGHLPLLFGRYLLHGIPEMLAYFVAALAGGILFITILRGDYSPQRIKRTALDSFVLILISILILVVAGLLEVYISPYV